MTRFVLALGASMYIIGDVHGCHRTLMALISKLPPDARICFVGDLIDRGPASAQIIEFVRSHGHDCVLGNHERMMLDYTPPGAYGDEDIWMYNGGLDTITSYRGTDLYETHLDWLASLPYYLEYPSLTIGDRHLLVSHSSFARTHQRFRPNTIPDHDDILWNRDVSSGTLPSSNPFFNVFGHTVSKEPIITDFFASIDTGAVYREHAGYGTLTAIHFPSLEIIQQPNIEEPS